MAQWSRGLRLSFQQLMPHKEAHNLIFSVPKDPISFGLLLKYLHKSTH